MTTREEIEEALDALGDVGLAAQDGLDANATADIIFAELGCVKAAIRRAVEGLDWTDKTLTVPAAEYVPAISDAFEAIDKTKADILKILRGEK